MACHSTSGCPLDREHEFGRYFTVAIYPVPDMLLLAGSAASPCKGGLPSRNPYRPAQVLFLHSHII
jgi:hypothetical protein